MYDVSVANRKGQSGRKQFGMKSFVLDEQQQQQQCVGAFVLLRVFHRINIIFQCLNKERPGEILRAGGI